MPPVKVKQQPKVIKIVQPSNEVPVEYEPDLVRVRATDRGYYGVREAVRDPRDNKRKIERNAVIKNVGEVFDMDAFDMRSWPLGPTRKTKDDTHLSPKQEMPHASENGLTVIETERAGQRELPSWVVLAEEAKYEDTLVASGHQTVFGKKDGELIPNPS